MPTRPQGLKAGKPAPERAAARKGLSAGAGAARSTRAGIAAILEPIHRTLDATEVLLAG